MAKVKKPKSKARRIIEWVIIGIFGALFLVVGAGQIESMVNKDTYFSQPIRFGLGNFIVKTDSMVPEYPKGTAIITLRKDPEVIYNEFISGKTVDITFMDACTVTNEYTKPTDSKYNDRTKPLNMAMTHRLREVHINPNAEKWKGRYVFIVAGINSQGIASREGQYQAFTDRYLLGEVIIHSDFLGGVFGFVASPWGLFVLLLVPAFYLVIVSVLDIFKALKEPQAAAAGDTPSEPKNTGSSLAGLSEADKARLKQEMLNQMLEKKAAERKAKLEAEKKEEKEDA